MFKTKKRLLASDIEAKGYYEVVNTVGDVHCLCSIDMESKEILLFHNYPEYDGAEVFDPYDNKTYIIPNRVGTLQEGIEFWEAAVKDGSILIIHNAHTYDRPVIEKVWPDIQIPFESYHDTYNQSKVQWYERPTPKGAKGPHGLAAYAKLMGIHKPEVTDWEHMDAFKLHRVVEDVKTQVFCYNRLQAEAKELKDSYGIDFTSALKVENLYAAECFAQEVRGAKADAPHILRCVKDLDEKTSKLREEIEPQLPPSLSGNGKKISRSEMATLFGYDGSRVVDNIVQRKRNGEIEDVVEKPYFQPVTNIYSEKKITKYQAYHPEYEFSPCFSKKKEFTSWRKGMYPKTKPKEWLVDKVEEVIISLKPNVADRFGLDTETLNYVCGPFTKVDITPSTMDQPEVVKSFLVKLGLKDFEEWNLKKDIHGKKIKVEFLTEVRWPPNANPEDQAVVMIPKNGYMVSSPKLSENDYSQLPEGLGRKIAEYNTYQHRRGFLQNSKDPENKGILSYVREDGRIPCGVNNFGTRSGRGAHRVWVNAAGKKSLYGEEIRKTIISEEGYSLVGADMKSAQLSIAAYYANNEEYYNNVATGEEKNSEGVYVGMSGHCVNARMFGMVSEEDWKRAVETQDPDLIHKISIIRDNSKGGSFATLFGASGKKVGLTIGIPESEGNARKKQFLAQMGLDDTIKRLEEFGKTYRYKGGYFLPLAFGYWLWNNSAHKDANTIIQGNEALCQKLAVIRAAKEVRRKGLETKMWKIIDYQDEMLYECEEGYEDQCGELLGEAYTWAAEQVFKYHQKHPEHFANYSPPKFAIDLNGGYSVGKNYLQCH